MLNQIILVGKIVNKTKLGEDMNDKKTMELTIAVPRTFKNENGEYDTDLINIVVYGIIAENANDNIEIGCIVGVKGRIARLENEVLHIVAEKITYLSSKDN